MKTLRSLGAALLVILLTAACFEGMVRIYLAHRNAGQAVEVPLAIFEHAAPLEPGSVFTLKRNHRQPWRAPEFSVEVALDAQGIRRPSGPAPEALEVIFLGDSFAFGHGVTYDEMFSTVAARAAGLERAASLSYLNGFQPEHYEFFLQERPQLRPRHIVVGLYLGNDLDSDIGETTIRRRGDGKIEALLLPARRILATGEYGVALPACAPLIAPFCRLAPYLESVRFTLNQLNRMPTLRDRLFASGVPNRPNDPDVEEGRGGAHPERAFASLKRIDALAKERGGQLTVLLITQNFLHGTVANPHLHRSLVPRAAEMARTKPLVEYTRARCAQLGLACVDLLGQMDAKDFFPNDAHWNASGHRKAGEALAARLR